MRRRIVVWIMVLGIFLTQSPQGAFAATAEELEAEMKALHEEYEEKLSQLQVQIDALKKEQEEQKKQAQVSLKKTEEQKAKVDQFLKEKGYEETGFGERISRNVFGFGNVSVGGYVATEFENFENTNSSFDSQRWIINIGAQLADPLYFYSEYEIEHGGPSITGGEAKVEQAWLDYLIKDWINFRSGIMLVPMGRYNLLHDDDLQDLIERPIVVRRIIPGTWMEVGAGLHGRFEPGAHLEETPFEDLSVNYEIYVVNGLDEDISDTGLRNAKGSLGGGSENNNKAVTGRIGISPMNNVEVGVAGYVGKFGGTGTTGTANGEDQILGGALDASFKKGPFELVGDYVLFDLEDGAMVDHDNDNVAGDLVAAPSKLQGFYVEPRYHFWPSFLNETFLGSRFENPTFTLVGRYDWAEIKDDGDSGTGDNEETRWTIGLNYRPVESFVIKTEYQFNETDNETLERGNNNGFMASVAMGF